MNTFKRLRDAGLFRCLTADIPGELLAAQIAANAHPIQTAVGTTPETPAVGYDDLFATLGFLAENSGVIEHTMPGVPTPVEP